MSKGRKQGGAAAPLAARERGDGGSKAAKIAATQGGRDQAEIVDQYMTHALLMLSSLAEVAAQHRLMRSYQALKQAQQVVFEEGSGRS